MLLTRSNFIYESTPNVNQPDMGLLMGYIGDPDITISGPFVPSNYTGGVNFFKIIIYGTDDQNIEWVLYAWDITLINRASYPHTPYENTELKINYFASPDVGISCAFDTLKWGQTGTSRSIQYWTNVRYACVYSPPIILS
jgi:hypothetical protein